MNKSKEASQETTKMIENCRETAEPMNRIVQVSAVSTDLVHKISSASQQQDLSIQQVTNGMDQISSVVQTNSAT